MNMSLHCSLSIPAAWCSDCCYILVISYEVFRCMWRRHGFLDPETGLQALRTLFLLLFLLLSVLRLFQLTIINFITNALYAAISSNRVHDCRHGPGVYKLGLVAGQHVEISQYRRHRYYRTFPGPTATDGCSDFHKNDNQILN